MFARCPSTRTSDQPFVDIGRGGNMGIALSKLWERLFSGKNYKIIIIGAMCMMRAACCACPLAAAPLPPPPAAKRLLRTPRGGAGVAAAGLAGGHAVRGQVPDALLGAYQRLGRARPCAWAHAARRSRVRGQGADCWRLNLAHDAGRMPGRWRWWRAAYAGACGRAVEVRVCPQLMISSDMYPASLARTGQCGKDHHAL